MALAESVKDWKNIFFKDYIHSSSWWKVIKINYLIVIVHTCQIPPALVSSYLDQSLNDKKHAILELQINILQGNLSLILPLQVWNQVPWVSALEFLLCIYFLFCPEHLGIYLLYKFLHLKMLFTTEVQHYCWQFSYT